MDQAENVVEVGNDEDTASVLHRIEKFPQGSHVTLRVPRDASTLRSLEDFNELRELQRRHKLALTVVSPEQTIIGLARIYGFEVQNTAPKQQRPAMTIDAPEEEGPLPRFPTAHRQPADPAPDPNGGNGSGAAQSASPANPPAQYSTSLPPQAAPPGDQGPAPWRPGQPSGSSEIIAPALRPGGEPPSESDWLFGGVEGAEAEPMSTGGEQRTTTPPPDVTFNMPGGSPDESGGAAQSETFAPAGASVGFNSQPPGGYAGDALDEEDGYSPPAAGHGRPASRGGRSRGLGGLFGWRFTPRKSNGAPAPASRGAGPATRSWTTAAQAAGAGTLLGDRPAAPFAPHAEGSLAVDSASSVVASSTAAPALDSPVVTGTPRRLYPDALARRRTRSASARRSYATLLPIALVLLLLVLAGGLWAINNVVPTWATAQVVIVPRASEQVGPIEVSVPVRLGAGQDGAAAGAPDGQGGTSPEPSGGILDLSPKTAPAIEAQLIQKEIVVEETRPTTGERQVPNNPARGTIEFTNQGSEPIFVPAGAELGTVRGYSFVTAAEVTIPGTDFWSRRWGTARVDFVATQPGPEANGTSLSGGYSNAVYFTVQASQGGDTRAIKQVSDADVQQLLDDLRGRIAGQAAQEVLAGIPPGMVAIDTTVSIPEDSWKPEFNHAVGEDADELTLRLTAVPQVYAYSPAALESAIQAALTGGIVTQAMPLDTQVDAASIAHGEITAASPPQDGIVIYSTTATALVEYEVTQQMLEAIRELIAGKTPNAARQAVMTSPYGPYVADIQFNLSHPLGWQIDTLPADSREITLRVATTPEPK